MLRHFSKEVFKSLLYWESRLGKRLETGSYPVTGWKRMELLEHFPTLQFWDAVRSVMPREVLCVFPVPQQCTAVTLPYFPKDVGWHSNYYCLSSHRENTQVHVGSRRINSSPNSVAHGNNTITFPQSIGQAVPSLRQVIFFPLIIHRVHAD